MIPIHSYRYTEHRAHVVCLHSSPNDACTWMQWCILAHHLPGCRNSGSRGMFPITWCKRPTKILCPKKATRRIALRALTAVRAITNEPVPWSTLFLPAFLRRRTTVVYIQCRKLNRAPCMLRSRSILLHTLINARSSVDVLLVPLQRWTLCVETY